MTRASSEPGRVPDRVRLPLDFDAEALAADLAAVDPADWVRQPFKANFEGSWDVLPLRSPAGETHPLRLIYADPAATSFVATAWLRRMPAFRAALAKFECPLRSVRLMRLRPGSLIKPHSDDLDAEGGNLRLHVPVASNPRVEFRLAGRAVEMAPGSVWYLRLSEEHEAANRGATDRIHLVIDAAVNDWLNAILRGGRTG
jgi:hypothetical protein